MASPRHVRSPERNLRAQRLWGNAWASYLVSSDFCGSGGGPTIGGLHLGGICTRKRSVTTEDSHCLETTRRPFPLFGRLLLGSYISAPGYSCGGHVNSGALLFQDTKEVGINKQPRPTCLSFLGPRSRPSSRVLTRESRGSGPRALAAPVLSELGSSAFLQWANTHPFKNIPFAIGQPEESSVACSEQQCNRCSHSTNVSNIYHPPGPVLGMGPALPISGRHTR